MNIPRLNANCIAEWKNVEIDIWKKYFEICDGIYKDINQRWHITDWWYSHTVGTVLKRLLEEDGFKVTTLSDFSPPDTFQLIIDW